jgi:hypothetical protein
MSRPARQISPSIIGSKLLIHPKDEGNAIVTSSLARAYFGKLQVKIEEYVSAAYSIFSQAIAKVVWGCRRYASFAPHVQNSAGPPPPCSPASFGAHPKII